MLDQEASKFYYQRPHMVKSCIHRHSNVAQNSLFKAAAQEVTRVDGNLGDHVEPGLLLAYGSFRPDKFVN